MDQNIIACKASAADYPKEVPFHPDTRYAEYRFGETSRETNAVYEAVRSCLRMAGLDLGNYGTTAWNPLKGLIKPGETVLLKPNLVKEEHPRDVSGWRYVLTNGSIIRAIADYVWLALDGRGKIILADAPQTDSCFEKIVTLLGLDAIKEFYRKNGLNFELLDLRQEEWTSRNGVVVSRRRLSGDPAGYIAYDLGQSSEFADHKGAGRYYGADYDVAGINIHHSNGHHQYLISASVIQCDVIFSLPKLKTHKKAGVTLSLKNLVGINGDKNWLPHYTEGTPLNDGDESPGSDAIHQTERMLIPYFRDLSQRIPGLGPWLQRQARRVGSHLFGDTEKTIRSGNWWGNDTIWRMCLDLNKIALYGNPDGTLRHGMAENRKRHYVLVDGIIAGEGRGPMNPDPFPAGIVVFGLHPARVDAACAYLMGYDPGRIPTISHSFHCRHYPVADGDWPDIRIVSNRPEWNGLIQQIADNSTFHFEPHFGWKGMIERKDTPEESKDVRSGGTLSQIADTSATDRL
jgi:uncharacterized protein (DUF362 family)